MLQTSFILNEIGTKCKSKLIPVAKIHTAYLILTNFDIKKLLSFLNIEVAKERPWLKKSLFLCEKTNLVASSTTIHTACLILTNFNIKKLLSFLSFHISS